MTIPGYLFGGGKATMAQLDGARTLGTRFLHPAEGSIDGIRFPAGTWHLTASGAGPFRLSARRQSDGATATRVSDGVELVLEEPGLVDITVVANPAAFLTEVVARRTGKSSR